MGENQVTPLVEPAYQVHVSRADEGESVYATPPVRFPEYPKTETLYDREPHGNRKVMLGHVRKPEFAAVCQWVLSEKIDGTNVRVCWDPDNDHLDFRGRTDRATLPAPLQMHLQLTFSKDAMRESFPDSAVVLFGEGYGEKIQSGDYYRNGVSFRMFDALVLKETRGWWLKYEDVEDVSRKLGTKPVPFWRMTLGLEDFPRTLGEMKAIAGASRVALLEKEILVDPEGIVAKSEPLMFDRAGERVMWKLKLRDF